LAKDIDHKKDTLLTYMVASGNSDTHPGDIWCVLASSQAPSDKEKNLNLNEAQNDHYTVAVGNEKNYINKGEIIAFNSQHYLALNSYAGCKPQ
jgi:hypothetical protein